MKEKLIAVAQEQALADFNQIKGDVVEATFGQQIRNYVFAPYKMVKDTRTGYETSQVDMLTLTCPLRSYYYYSYVTITITTCIDI